MGRMESGGIELRGEVGRSNSSGQPFFRTSSWAGGVSFLFFSFPNLGHLIPFVAGIFSTAFFIIPLLPSSGLLFHIVHLLFFGFFLVDIYSFCVLGGGFWHVKFPHYFLVFLPSLEQNLL